MTGNSKTEAVENTITAKEKTVKTTKTSESKESKTSKAPKTTKTSAKKAVNTKTKKSTAGKVKKAKKNLVIVESPAKANTIMKFLGKNYTVMASMGHVRDLPKSHCIDIENDYEPSI